MIGDERDEPERIRSSLDRVLSHLRKPPSDVLSLVFDSWRRLVGSTIADYSRPVNVRDGVLTVEVDDPAVGEQLRWMADDVLTTITNETGRTELTRLVVRTARTLRTPGDGGGDHSLPDASEGL